MQSAVNKKDDIEFISFTLFVKQKMTYVVWYISSMDKESADKRSGVRNQVSFKQTKKCPVQPTKHIGILLEFSIDSRGK
jgi:hypothetical protein